MGILNFLPIQDGTGDPSPSNIRPIHAPLNIDGIGEIYGGTLDTNKGILSCTHSRITLATSNTTVVSQSTNLPGYYGYPYSRYMRTTMGALKTSPRAICDSLPYYTKTADFTNGNTSGFFKPGSSSIYYWIHPDCATAEGAESLRTAGIVFVGTRNTPQEYQLTTAQLHQALDQLKIYFGGELPISQMTDIRRRVLLYDSFNGLPGTYKRVEYLQSTGTQWIDTGILTSETLKIYSMFTTDNNSSSFVYGVRSSHATITCASGTSTNWGYARWGNSAYAARVPNGTVKIEQDSSGIDYNGTHWGYNLNQNVVSAEGYTITVFAGRTSLTEVSSLFVGKIYYFRIKDNGKLVCNLIPCLRKSDSKPGMYDTVSKTFLTNAGTGEFSVPA